MASDAPRLIRFIRRLHRRLIVVRLLECSAIGVAFAAAVSVLLLPLLILREKSAFLVVTILLPLGAIVGACWALLRRPRAIDAAGEADRQLRLADLLSTAWIIVQRGGSQSDPFERAVLLIADARAAMLAPSSVVLNRLGARTWTGIGLASALAVTLALLSANPMISQADAPSPLARNADVSRGGDEANRSSDGNRNGRALPIVKDHSGRKDEEAFNPARHTTEVSGGTADSSGDTASADPAGSGGGTGTSRSPKGDLLANATASTSRSQSGLTAGGGGGGTRGMTGVRDGASSMAAGNGASRRDVPPWTTVNWSAARSAAAEAVRSDAVPSQYHDLIRSYFDRQEQR